MSKSIPKTTKNAALEQGPMARLNKRLQQKMRSIVPYGRRGGGYLRGGTDLGECKDRGGVDRRSGRSYKTTFGEPNRTKTDLSRLSNGQLVELELHWNGWFVRQSRRILQGRAAAGEDISQASRRLLGIFELQHDVTPSLLPILALHPIDALVDMLLILIGISHF